MEENLRNMVIEIIEHVRAAKRGDTRLECVEWIAARGPGYKAQLRQLGSAYDLALAEMFRVEEQWALRHRERDCRFPRWLERTGSSVRQIRAIQRRLREAGSREWTVDELEDRRHHEYEEPCLFTPSFV